MEQVNVSIRLLELKIAHVQHTLQPVNEPSEEEITQGQLLIDVIEHYLRDYKRKKIEQRAGTLDDLAQLKVGIRLADGSHKGYERSRYEGMAVR